jgi:hypothetical protein
MSGNFFRHLCELVLRHQMQVSNYFVNSFYSVEVNSDPDKINWLKNYQQSCWE